MNLKEIQQGLGSILTDLTDPLIYDYLENMAHYLPVVTKKIRKLIDHATEQVKQTIRLTKEGETQ